MAVYSRKSSGPVMRSLSPSGRFCGGSYAPSQSSSAFASSSSSFMSSRSATVFDHHHHQSHRAASPTRVNLRGSSSAYAQSVRFSLTDRPISPNRSIAVAPKQSHHGHGHGHGQRKRTCLCSPTNHPGSFRCSFHKNAAASGSGSAPFAPNRLNARRSAMTNSLVRIGGVEGADLVKRALAALIRPSSHQQRRRGSFQARPSRLSVMSKAEDS